MPLIQPSEMQAERPRHHAPRNPVSVALESMSHRVTLWTGSSLAFTVALGAILLWAALGPVFHYSDTWQLVINTSTTIVTFLMVFLIQRSQNKDSQAIHLKLNELVSAMQGASNTLISVEDLSEEELKVLHQYYATLSRLAKSDRSLTESHSVEEAKAGHAEKSQV